MLSAAGWRVRLCAVAGVAILGATTLFAGTAHADPATQCPDPTDPGQKIAGVPWAQKQLGAQRAWPFSDGTGTTVAILAVGIDDSNPQLDGQVLDGESLGKDNKDGHTDCVGYGTQMAGIIAARHATTTGFRGIAPGTKLLPVAMGNYLKDAASNPEATIDPHTLALGFDAAVKRHVDVICDSAIALHDTAELRDAVQNALAHDIVVVAPVGNQAGTGGNNPTPYPANYPGVIGVGATTSDGTLMGNSQHGKYVDLVAPGEKVVTTQRVGGLIRGSGTYLSAAFVAATAALVRGRFDGMSPADVEKRLKATATPMSGGPDSPRFGAGMVNPYRAVTEDMASGAPRAMPGYHPARSSRPEIERANAWTDSSQLAMLVAALVGLAALGVVGAAVTIPRGRRRRWRARLAAPLRDRPEDDLPSPPVELFAKPK